MSVKNLVLNTWMKQFWQGLGCLFGHRAYNQAKTTHIQPIAKSTAMIKTMTKILMFLAAFFNPVPSPRLSSLSSSIAPSSPKPSAPLLKSYFSSMSAIYFDAMCCEGQYPPLLTWRINDPDIFFFAYINKLHKRVQFFWKSYWYINFWLVCEFHCEWLFQPLLKGSAL